MLLLGLSAGLLTGLIEALVLLSRRLGTRLPGSRKRPFRMDGSGRRPGALRRSRAGTGTVRSTLAEVGPGSAGVLSVCVPGLLGLAIDGTRVHKVAVLALAAGLAWQAARLLSRRTEAWDRRSGMVLATLAAGVALIGVTTVGFYAVRERVTIGRLPAAAGNRPNVLLIILGHGERRRVSASMAITGTPAHRLPVWRGAESGSSGPSRPRRGRCLRTRAC